MKRKTSEIIDIVGDCQYLNCHLLKKEQCIVRDNCKKDDLVWAARKTDGFRVFSATIYDVNPAYPESVELRWTDLTQNDLFVNVCYVFPRVRVYYQTIQSANPHAFDKVEEWLLKISNYSFPSDCTF